MIKTKCRFISEGNKTVVNLSEFLNKNNVLRWSTIICSSAYIVYCIYKVNLSTNPSHKTINLARSHLLSGEFDKSVNLLQKLHHNEPENVKAIVYLTRSYAAKSGLDIWRAMRQWGSIANSDEKDVPNQLSKFIGLLPQYSAESYNNLELAVKTFEEMPLERQKRMNLLLEISYYKVILSLFLTKDILERSHSIALTPDPFMKAKHIEDLLSLQHSQKIYNLLQALSQDIHLLRSSEKKLMQHLFANKRLMWKNRGHHFELSLSLQNEKQLEEYFYGFLDPQIKMLARIYLKKIDNRHGFSNQMISLMKNILKKRQTYQIFSSILNQQDLKFELYSELRSLN